MNPEEVDAMLVKAKREDGTYDGEIVSQLNAAGISLLFLPEGVRWSRTK